MTPRQLVRTSKFLSRHLRHRPDALGLELQDGGWVDVQDLLDAAARHGQPITRAELEEVVAQNDKQRFSFDASGTRIRASQGHSVDVDLGLQPIAPPTVLYHGTGAQTAPTIEREGLRRMRRDHVHLSAELETARRVGARHGRPVVFEVAAGALHADGILFFRSDNGVWLVNAVPPRYVHRLGNAEVEHA
jgi:putative RNA 2'-phosphotransferase